MEILLAFAIAAVAVACLVIAATFRARAVKHSAPGIDEARQELKNQIDRQYQGIQDEANRMRLSSERAVTNLETRINELAEGQQRNLAQAEHLRALIRDLQETARGTRAEYQGMAADIHRTQGDMISDLQNVHGAITRLETGSGQAKVASDQLQQRVAGIHTSLNGLSRRVEAADKSLGELRKEVTASRQEIHPLFNFNQELGERLMYVSGEITSVQQELDEVRLFIQRGFEYKRTTAGDPGQLRVVTGGLSCDPSSMQVAWKLCEIFWTTLSMKLLFRYSVKATITFFYLMWNSPDGRSVENCMMTLFRNCQPEHEDVIGLEEFNGILQVLYDGKPATLKIGSAVITWSGDELLAGIIAEDHASDDDTALLQPAAYAARLRHPDTAFFVDLTAWARDYAP